MIWAARHAPRVLRSVALAGDGRLEPSRKRYLILASLLVLRLDIMFKHAATLTLSSNIGACSVVKQECFLVWNYSCDSAFDRDRLKDVHTCSLHYDLI